MKKTKLLFGVLSLSVALLVGCSNETKDNPTPEESQDVPAESHDEMVHDDSGEIPAGLKEAEDPTYKVGDTAKILTDHMEGMEGAEATIVGAFDTIAYEVSYDPTNGDPREENHKWVVQEEVKDASEDPLTAGSEVTLEADHMKGMEGAKAVIESYEKTTVYMIDYTPATGGKEVKNHKWVTEDEVSSL